MIGLFHPLGENYLPPVLRRNPFWIEPVGAHKPRTLNVEPLNLGYKLMYARQIRLLDDLFDP